MLEALALETDEESRILLLEVQVLKSGLPALFSLTMNAWARIHASELFLEPRDLRFLALQ